MNRIYTCIKDWILIKGMISVFITWIFFCLSNHTTLAQTATNNSPICAGANLELTGGGGGIYTWTGPNGFGSGDQNPIISNVTSAATGVYTLTVVNGSSTTTVTTAVTINALPVPNPSSDSPKCVGTTLSFNSVAGMDVYAWSGPNPFTSNTQNPSISNVTSDADGVYTLTVTNSNSCTASATISVTIHPLPIPIPSSDSPKCVGTTLTFNSVAGMTTYAWSGPNLFTGNIQNPSISNVTSAANGVYTLTVTGSNGCTASPTNSVTINALPIPIPSSDSPKCVGTTLTFNSVAGMTSYVWSGPNLFTGNTQNPSISTVTNAANGVYTLTITDSNGCTTSATTSVTIHALPIPNPSSDSPKCVGTTLTFNSVTGMASYAWSGPNSFTDNTQNPSISNVTIGANGVYTLSVINSNGCTSTATTSVLVNPSNILFVNDNATGANNGSSWANAFTDLQAALDYTLCAINEIWVAGGIYKTSKDASGNSSPGDIRDKTFYLQNSKKIYGGFAGTETSLIQRTGAVIAANPSVLNGDVNDTYTTTDDAYHVVLSVSDNNLTLLDGFTITKGNATGNGNITLESKNISKDSGGGMYTNSSSMVIANCIFTGNNAYFGAGIYNEQSTPTINNCNFSSNASTYGGGIYNFESSPVVSNCSFSSNSTVQGGGMLNYSSSPTLTNCSFSANNATNFGGGIYNTTNSSPNITSCTFSSNSATSFGGGINNSTSSSPTITNCTFSVNNANFGGGVYNFLNSSPLIQNCTFFANNAPNKGGGIHNESDSNPTIKNCVFSANNANSGGGLYNQSASPTVNDCSFVNNTAVFGGGIGSFGSIANINNCLFITNSASSAGGGMYNSSSSFPLVFNCTFSSNSSATGGGIFNASLSNPTIKNDIFWANKKGTNANIKGSDIENGSDSKSTVSYSSLQLLNTLSNYPVNGSISGFQGRGIGNIFANDPLFVNVLDPNGADNIYGNVDDGLVLQNCSPLINRGGNSGTPLTDITGATRIINSHIDMGAYENIAPSRVSIAVNPTGAFCFGTSVTFTATPTSGGGTPTYNFKVNGESKQNTTSNIFTTTSLLDGDVVGVFFNSTTCTVSGNSNPLVMSVYSLPVAVSINNSPICASLPLNLSASNSSSPLSSDTYVWSGPNFTSNIFNPIIANSTVSMSGTYSVTITNSNGCTSTATTVVTINPLPSPLLTTNSPKCEKTTIDFSASNSNTNIGNSYSWAGPNSFSSLTQSNSLSNATVSLSGTYTVTITDSKGCSSTASVPIVVNALPVPSNSSNSPVCATNPLNLLVSGGLSYAWTGPNGFSSTSANPSLSNSVLGMSGTYIVTATDVNSCTATTSTTVLINPLPIPEITNNSPICAGATLNLTAANLSLDEGNSFLWAGPNGFTSALQNPSLSTTSVLENGTYTVTITDEKGCSASATSAVVIRMLPSASASSNTPICTGLTLDLTTSNTSIPNGNSFSWSGPDGFTSSLKDPSILNSNTSKSGTYSVIITDVNGCISTASTEVTVFALPIPTAGSNSPVCTGTTLNLSASNTTPGLNNTFLWDGPNGFSSNIFDPIVSNPTISSSGTYSLTVTDINGCTASISTAVIINPLPVPSVGSNSPICLGNALSLNSSNTSSLDLNNTYSWSGPNSFSSTQRNPSLNSSALINAGSYTVTITDVNGCTATNSTAVLVNVLPIINLSSNSPKCSGLRLDINSANTNSPTGNLYSWQGPNGLTSANQNISILDPSTLNSGNYTVTITDNNGCSSTASTQVVIFSNPVLIAGSNSPICDGLSLNLTSSNTSFQFGNVYSWSGPNGFSSIVQNPNISNSSNLTAGIYSVSVTDINGCISSTSTSVIIKGKPAVPTITPPSPLIICAPSTLSLSASGCAGTVTWSDTSIGSNLVLSIVGTYSLSAICTDGCVSDASPVISGLEKKAKPSVPIVTAPSSLLVCSPSILTLTATCATGTVVWSNNTTGSSLVLNTVGIYAISAICLSNGCSSNPSTTLSLQIKDKPNTPVVIPPTNLEVCFPLSLSMSASCTTGTVLWSNNTAGTSLTLSSIGSYSISAKCILNGCESDASLTISGLQIKAKPSIPTVSVPNPSIICFPGTLTMTANCTTGIVNWSNNTTGGSLQLSDIGTYSVTANCNLLGCTSNQSSSSNLEIKTTPAAPTIVAPPNLSVCSPSSLTLSATCASGTVLWSNNSTGSSITLSSIGTYNISATCNLNNCISSPSSTISLEIKASPVPYASSNSPICAGNTLNLMSSGGSSYSWNGPNSFVSAQQNPSILNSSVSLSGIYTVSVIGSNACTSTAAVTVQISQNQPLSINANPSAVSAGATTTLTVSGCSGGVINWSINNLNSNPLIIAINNTTTLTTSCTLNGCTSVASITIPVNPCLSELVLVSNADDYNTGTYLKTASSINGKIKATNKIENLARVTYKAKSIELNAGFKAENGTLFLAEVGGCN